MPNNQQQMKTPVSVNHNNQYIVTVFLLYFMHFYIQEPLVCDIIVSILNLCIHYGHGTELGSKLFNEDGIPAPRSCFSGISIPSIGRKGVSRDHAHLLLVFHHRASFRHMWLLNLLPALTWGMPCSIDTSQWAALGTSRMAAKTVEHDEKAWHPP